LKLIVLITGLTAKHKVRKLGHLHDQMILAHHGHIHKGKEVMITRCFSTPSKDWSRLAELGSHSGNLNNSKLPQTRLFTRHSPLEGKSINNVNLYGQGPDFTIVISILFPTSSNQVQS